MTVVCKFTQCPYSVNGFCLKKTIKIDQWGMCSVIWRRGQRRDRISFFNEEKGNMEIITEEKVAVANDINQQKGRQNEQGGETQNDEKESKLQENGEKCQQKSGE